MVAKTARDIMNVPVAWITPGQTLKEVAKVLIDNDYSQAPVFDGARNVGRVTDLMLILQLKTATFAQVATKKVKDLPKYGEPFGVVLPATNVKEIQTALTNDLAVLVKLEDLPKSWGIITRADLLKLF